MSETPSRSSSAVARTSKKDLIRWKRNYTRLFGKKPDLTHIRIPARPEGFGPMRLIVVASEIIEWTDNHPIQGTVDTLKKHFLVRHDFEKDLDKAVTRNYRNPVNGTYALWIRDVQQLDEENRNLSAVDLLQRGEIGLTLLERILLEADYFFEKGTHMDQYYSTLCTGSRYHNEDERFVPCVISVPAGFCVTGHDESNRNWNICSRRVWTV